MSSNSPDKSNDNTDKDSLKESSEVEKHKSITESADALVKQIKE
jgi:hypothetical protein